MEDRLRECPICGNKDLVIMKYPIQDNEVYKYFSRRFSVKCMYTGNGIGCGIESGHYKTAEEAIDIWNTRHEPKHETVEEWEKRTGEIYPDDGPVWIMTGPEGIDENNSPYGEQWDLIEYGNEQYHAYYKIIVANHHGKPEEV